MCTKHDLTDAKVALALLLDLGVWGDIGVTEHVRVSARSPDSYR